MKKEPGQRVLSVPVCSFDGDDIVVDRLAAADEVDLGVRALVGEDVARLVRVLFRHIFAVKDGDELCPAGRGLVGKTAEQRGNITVGAVKLPVEQRKIVALVNVETSKSELRAA